MNTVDLIFLIFAILFGTIVIVGFLYLMKHWND